MSYNAPPYIKERLEAMGLTKGAQLCEDKDTIKPITTQAELDEALKEASSPMARAFIGRDEEMVLNNNIYSLNYRMYGKGKAAALFDVFFLDIEWQLCYRETFPPVTEIITAMMDSLAFQAQHGNWTVPAAYFRTKGTEEIRFAIENLIKYAEHVVIDEMTADGKDFPGKEKIIEAKRKVFRNKLKTYIDYIGHGLNAYLTARLMQVSSFEDAETGGTLSRLCLIETTGDKKRENATLHAWDGRAYKRLSDADIAALIMQISPALDTKGVREATATLRATLPVFSECDASAAVNLENGVYLEGRMLEHDPDAYHFTSTVPATYTKGMAAPSICGRPVDEILKETTGTPEIYRHIFELGANIIFGKGVGEAFLWYDPDGGSGKSMLLKLLQAVAAKPVNMSLDEFGDNAAIARIEGATFILGHETDPNASIKNTTKIKGLITGDPVTVRPLYKDPYDIVFRGVMVQAVNGMIRAGDKSNSLMRRFRMIPFSGNFTLTGRANPEIKERITERPVIDWFVSHCIELVESGEITLGKISEVSEEQELKKEFTENLDTVSAFVNDLAEYMGSDGCRIPYLTTASLEAAFEAWCEWNNVRNNFKRRTLSREVHRAIERMKKQGDDRLTITGRNDAISAKLLREAIADVFPEYVEAYGTEIIDARPGSPKEVIKLLSSPKTKSGRIETSYIARRIETVEAHLASRSVPEWLRISHHPAPSLQGGYRYAEAVDEGRFLSTSAQPPMGSREAFIIALDGVAPAVGVSVYAEKGDEQPQRGYEALRFVELRTKPTAAERFWQEAAPKLIGAGVERERTVIAGRSTERLFARVNNSEGDNNAN